MILLTCGMVAGNSFYTVAIGSILTLFLLKLGIREAFIGFLSILPCIIGLGSVFLIQTVNKHAGKLLVFSAAAMVGIEILFMPLFLLAGKLSFLQTVLLYTALIFFFHFLTQIYVLAWFPTLETLVGYQQRGHFFGIVRVASTFLGYGLLQIASYILGPDPAFVRFFWVEAMIVAVSIFWPVSFSRVNMPQFSVHTKGRINPVSDLRLILCDSDRSNYFWFLFLWTFLASAVGPFMMPFYKTELNLPTSYCVYLTSVTTFGYGLTVFAWGKLTDHRGSRFVLFISFLLGFLYMMLLAYVKFFPVRYIRVILSGIAFLGGIASAGQLMGDTTRRMALAPESEKFSYFSYVMIFGAQFPAIIASPLAGFILERNRYRSLFGQGIYQMLFIFVGLLHLVFFYRILRMKPIRERPVDEILKDVISSGLMKVRDVIASPVQ
jgi:hypothetical protein